jgi:ubiquinol oxidase
VEVNNFQKWYKCELSGGSIVIGFLVRILVVVIDRVYRHRSIARFYVLETVARVPYFSYLSVLHLYETMGWWRRADWLKIHFAESWNEMHHLLIMEELGGGSQWTDRWLAKGTAVIYYWIVVGVYFLSAKSAYRFMELVEGHAYRTYDLYLTEYATELQQSPAPAIALKYYRDGDLYLFDEFHSGQSPNERRPKIDNLYDVFVAIRDDEMEHIKTMRACQQPNAGNTLHGSHHSILTAPNRSECNADGNINHDS